MPAQIDSISAFVLAGGKSSRMGEDKAFLQLGEQSLLERSLLLAQSVTQDVKIVGSSAKFSRYAPVVEDIYPDRGPLGGIHAALSICKADLNLFLAVDLPFVEPEFLKYLLGVAERSEAIVTLPRIGNRWQPLCALYKRHFGKLAERALQDGKNKVDALFATVTIRLIEEAELAAQGFSPEMFRNLNTFEEWERTQAELKSSPSTAI
jgi:molybdenum cofactor guanylyltransferase